MLALTEEEIQRSEKARQEAEAARKAAEEKLVAEAEARRRRDAERIKLQVAPNAAPPEPKRAGPTKDELDATAAKVCLSAVCRIDPLLCLCWPPEPLPGTCRPSAASYADGRVDDWSRSHGRQECDGRWRAFTSIAKGCAAILTCAAWRAHTISLHLQMQALMAEAQASAAKAAAEKEKEAAQRALKARNVPAMLRGAKLNIMAQAPVKGNALQEAAAKAPPAPSTTPKASNEGANGIARSGSFQHHGPGCKLAVGV